MKLTPFAVLNFEGFLDRLFLGMAALAERLCTGAGSG